MKTTPVSIEDLSGVFPAPPLARKNDARRSIDFEQNNRIVRHKDLAPVARALVERNERG
ncbi:MAG: hypothetical protein ACREA2_10170 [Blastocatellia bacterium]